MTKEEIEKVEKVFADWFVLDVHKFEKVPDAKTPADVETEIEKWENLKKDCFTLQEGMEKSYLKFCTVVLAPLTRIK